MSSQRRKGCPYLNAKQARSSLPCLSGSRAASGVVAPNAAAMKAAMTLVLCATNVPKRTANTTPAAGARTSHTIPAPAARPRAMAAARRRRGVAAVTGRRRG